VRHCGLFKVRFVNEDFPHDTNYTSRLPRLHTKDCCFVERLVHEGGHNAVK